MSNSGDPSLEQLRDIVLPDHAVSWWPLAPGWWMVIVLVVLLAAAVMAGKPRWQRYRQQQARYRAARLSLQDAYACARQNGTSPQAVQQYLQHSNQLFKRLLLADGRLSSAARLSGDAWSRWLSQCLPHERFPSLYANQLYARETGETVALDELHHWTMLCLQRLSKPARHLVAPESVAT